MKIPKKIKIVITWSDGVDETNILRPMKIKDIMLKDLGVLGDLLNNPRR